MAGLELGIIKRPKHLHHSLALIVKLDYNFSSFFVFVRGQGKLRTDLEHLTKGSEYGGLGYNFNPGSLLSSNSLFIDPADICLFVSVVLC